MVLRTGFLTAKGSLVRSIMYPPPADFKFDQDSYKFIGILAAIAAIGFIYTLALKVLSEASARSQLLSIEIYRPFLAALLILRFFSVDLILCVSPRTETQLVTM